MKLHAWRNVAQNRFSARADVLVCFLFAHHSPFAPVRIVSRMPLPMVRRVGDEPEHGFRWGTGYFLITVRDGSRFVSIVDPISEMGGSLRR